MNISTWGSLGDLTKEMTLEWTFRDVWNLVRWKRVGRREDRNKYHMQRFEGKSEWRGGFKEQNVSSWVWTNSKSFGSRWYCKGSRVQLIKIFFYGFIPWAAGESMKVKSLKKKKKATSIPILLIHDRGHTCSVIGILILLSGTPFSLYRSDYEASNQMVALYTWKQRKETCIVLRNISSRWFGPLAKFSFQWIEVLVNTKAN